QVRHFGAQVRNLGEGSLPDRFGLKLALVNLLLDGAKAFTDTPQFLEDFAQGTIRKLASDITAHRRYCVIPRSASLATFNARQGPQDRLAPGWSFSKISERSKRSTDRRVRTGGASLLPTVLDARADA